ncbi:MAG: metal-dependent transcriptional regulator [Chitinophagaceae bacterium]
MELTQTEENYLKVLYRLTLEQGKREGAGATELSLSLDVKPASVNEMLKKLKEKGLVSYVKYGKISLTDIGQSQALHIIRKHRIWETFLFQELKYRDDEVHEIAEQLEHIQSLDLIERLFGYLGKPKKDPHGETIPSIKTTSETTQQIPLSKGKTNVTYTINAFNNSGKTFLQYMDRLNLHPEKTILVKEIHDFDHSLTLETQGVDIHVSEQVAAAIIVSRITSP